MSKEEKFLSLINSKIDKFHQQSEKHKGMFRKYRYSTFVFAALTSTLSGAALLFESIQTGLNFIIVIVGALAGLIASIEGLRKPQDLWTNEKNVHYELLDLKERFEFELESGTNSSTADYFGEMHQILNRAKTNWTKTVSPADKKKPAN